MKDLSNHHIQVYYPSVAVVVEVVAMVVSVVTSVRFHVHVHAVHFVQQFFPFYHGTWVTKAADVDVKNVVG